jgi:hypothetical protein
MVNSGNYKLGPQDGKLLVKIDPEGLGKGMAHALTLEVGDWSADVTVDDDISKSTVNVTANLGSLKVIKSSGQMSEKDKADIKKNTEKTIKGATATFKSKSISGDDKRAKVSGDLSAGSSSTPATMDLTLSDSKASGSMKVTHSSLGIKPYSAPMGIIKVKDGVTVEFEANLPK